MSKQVHGGVIWGQPEPELHFIVCTHAQGQYSRQGSSHPIPPGVYLEASPLAKSGKAVAMLCIPHWIDCAKQRPARDTSIRRGCVLYQVTLVGDHVRHWAKGD